MAELGSTSPTGRKRKTLMEQFKNKKKVETRRCQTRVNIGVAFQRWRILMEHTELKSDAIVALFLLDSYEKDLSSSTPVKPGLPRSPTPAVSKILSEELSDRDEQISLESIEELDNSAQETAFHELDASEMWSCDILSIVLFFCLFSMSSQDLNIGLINGDEFNHIPDPGHPPRHIIMRFLRWSDKNEVFKTLASAKGKLTWDGHDLRMFQDFPMEIQRQRKSYRELRSMLRKENLRHGILYPAILYPTNE
ncbi:LINE-1 retrotransposable element ORF1 protein [Dissostichus eleginoides]|uniref:LINE-1 retrotransposable element ORF1 protein n=1 Tax=Dissostichus eleginoides TaxID=100907 RepID=A0AAD9B581_DISEL|nr:LINE-1 retrotransposable element ORF1 protein [Dissostichus eleginoides]